MTRIIHTEHTLRQLAEARAAHAARCVKAVPECIICREHFGLVRVSA